MLSGKPVVCFTDLLSLKIKSLFSQFGAEGFSFWMVCGYFFFEYVRPQSIISGLDILPWTQILIMFSALGWLLDSRRGETVATPLNYWMVLFLVVIFLGSVTAYNSKVSFNEISNYYNWLIIFFLIQLIVTNEKRFYIFLLIFIFASFKLSLFGAKTWALRGFSFTSWGLRGPPGFFTNSGELAIQMNVFFGVSYYFYQSVKQHVQGIKLWIVRLCPITAAMTVMAASSRGAQLALVVQAYFVFLHGKISFKSIVSIVVVLGVMYYALPEEQLQRFESAGEDNTSKQRLLYWEHGWEMMVDHPFLGVGYYNFRSYYNKHYSDDLYYESAELPHNIFVQVGADLGFVGLFVYLVLIWYGFRIPVRIRSRLIEKGKVDDWRIPISKGLAVGFLGFIIAGQFVSVVYYPYMWIHLAMCAALLNSTHEANKITISRG
jgi:O-antigen ligase